MKVKILYTNGERTIELFWITHTGTDVYCGRSGSKTKKTYHASGKLHWKENDQEKSGVWISPLKDVKGQFHLMTIGLNNSHNWSEKSFKRIEYTRRKVDTALYIDARSIPEKQFFHVSIGLLEPFDFRVLKKLMGFSKNTKQLLLTTETEPWIYCMLIWPIQI